MRITLTTSDFGTLPVVAFYRLHVETKEPISLHSIIFETVDDAKKKANWIARQTHLRLIGITDGTFDDQRLSPQGKNNANHADRIRKVSR